MKYFFNTILNDVSFEDAIALVTAELKKEGFGILTEIDMKQALHEKLGVDIKEYKVLGACNPGFAYQALQHEAHIGLLLPCNLLVRQLDDDMIEVSAIDPIASMSMIENDQLGSMAGEVQQKLQAVISRL